MLDLNVQQKMSFHSELYNLIPKDHILVKIHELIDFSFILDFVKEHYDLYYGRRAKNPEMLFRLLFIQKLYNLSDERVISETAVNLAFKWFVGLNPEDPLPDPSLLCLFRLHKIGAGEVETLLTQVVKQCVDKGLIKSTTLIIDATHTVSRHQSSKPLQVLKQAAQRLTRAVKRYNNKLNKILPKAPELTGEFQEKEKQMLHHLAQLGEVVEQAVPDAEGSLKQRLEEAYKIVEDERLLAWKGVKSAIDPDARFGWKSKNNSFFGYKESVAMTEDGIITAVKVESGNKSDPKAMPDLIEKTKHTGVEIKEVIADKAYGSSTNLQLLESNQIKATIALNPSVYAQSNEHRDQFTYHKDSDSVECPAGHLSIRKAKDSRNGSGKSPRINFYFDVNLCETCPLQQGCYKPGSKHKIHAITIFPEYRKRAMEYEHSEDFKARYKNRYKIEQKNHELKNHHGLAKTQYSRGLLGMRIQTVLTAIVVNIKRMVKIVNTTPQ